MNTTGTSCCWKCGGKYVRSYNEVNCFACSAGPNPPVVMVTMAQALPSRVIDRCHDCDLTVEPGAKYCRECYRARTVRHRAVVTLGSVTGRAAS